MADRPLRAVSQDERPAQPRPTTLKAAAESSERDLLVMMRDNISDRINEGVPPHTLAPLMRQLREIDKEIRGFDARAAQDSARGHSGEVDSSFDASAI